MTDFVQYIISNFLKYVLGLSFLDFFVVLIIPFSTKEDINFIRLMIAFFSLIIGVLIMYYKIKDYKINKETKDLIKKHNEEKDVFRYVRDYREKED
ncbi:hypothetical protein H9I45_15190 [Polaribacter haliotis]|uniref:Uncharacterized protein n=1 Tax=Polaribacter haliotis TaxID=1888915 RepID=A0A7L8AFE4_9FLAO|nr:hypothetical protein [Polaribacter haliotis]QOD60664.1 hypothetical protein H9I45_15190 [Polaribacter haliotis]